MDKWTDGWMMDEYKILKNKQTKFPSIGIRNGAKMQAQSLQLVKLALLLMVIIHSHQQQQMYVYTHTHTNTHTHAQTHPIPFPTCLDLQRYGFNGSRRAPKSTLLTCTQVILKGVCPSVSGSLDSGESQGGVGMG